MHGRMFATTLLLLFATLLATGHGAINRSAAVLAGNKPLAGPVRSGEAAAGPLCTSFCIDNAGYSLHGANLEHQSFYQGLLYVNRRGVSKEGLEQHVLFPGYIQDSDLPAYYTGAQALCLISFHEGFGLPVAEAAKCACPSIISNCSSLPEIGGEGAIAVPPNDLEAIADALIQLLDQSKRDNLSRKAEKQGRLFSWSKCAEQVIQVYKELSP